MVPRLRLGTKSRGAWEVWTILYLASPATRDSIKTAYIRKSSIHVYEYKFTKRDNEFALFQLLIGSALVIYRNKNVKQF